MSSTSAVVSSGQPAHGEWSLFCRLLYACGTPLIRLANYDVSSNFEAHCSNRCTGTLALRRVYLRAVLCNLCQRARLAFRASGYDIELGPFHLHAYSLRNWPILCFALALATTWLEGRRAGSQLPSGCNLPSCPFLGLSLSTMSTGTRLNRRVIHCLSGGFP